MTTIDVRTSAAVSTRWDAPDVLRGLTIMLLFALACILLIFAVLVVCHRKRWILRL